MAGNLITVTDAGRAALVAPGNAGTTAHKIVEIGLASAAFVADKSMKALPNERKRITTFAGENVAADTIHVTLKDDTADQFTLYGFGLYLENGVLAAVYGQATPIMEKSTGAMLLLSADLQFATIDAAQLVFGDATFTNPPATTDRQGVVRLATRDEAIAGTDTKSAVTPAGMSAAFAPAIAGKSDKGHKHAIADVDGLQGALDGKSPVGHKHVIADVNGLQDALDTRLGVGGGNVSGDVRLKSTSQYSPRFLLDANGYAPFLRSNSTAKTIEAINSANTALNASLDDNGVLTLPRARPSWAGVTPWDSGNLDPYTKAGGELAGNAAFQTRTAYGKTAYQVLAPDGTGIGGAYVDWNSTRAPALQIDSPNSGSAYMGFRWTRWSGRHFAAIDAYEGGSATSAPTISMHLDGQANAWSFGRTDITRGAGGTVYGTWNFNPASYLPVNGRAYSAGRLYMGGADTLFNWAGQPGQPTWLLGGWDQNNIYVFNPSNFSVNYANSSDYANRAGSVNGVWNPATAGATCRRNNLIELGQLDGRSTSIIDAPDPYVLMGLHVAVGTDINRIWQRVIYMSNQ
ncbi:hypothetical protein [Paraburkholderia domus]|uniref:Phage tail protein n=1 Tax=Paraburkholderia domus TaxID=2793075 RepID=A0A9N8QTK5_9BURK|nr:hypothetical protein [Paraburkholderia domus]MBK5163939.1 hypothetical protein [Burkholderia sp. R-70211]CAE6856134.1 hypothetical protein R70211_00173 [Paraburkholderia domus]